MSINRYKIAMIGDSSVGKTSIALRFCKESFIETGPTVGATYLTRKVALDDKKNAQFEIWDTAGQERYNALVPMYLNNSQAIFIVFDLSDISTFENIKKRWINVLEKRISKDNKFICYLIGNKNDLKHNKISYEKIEEIQNILDKSDINMTYYESSAKTNHNINKIFLDLARDLNCREDISPLADNLLNNQRNKQYCCL